MKRKSYAFGLFFLLVLVFTFRSGTVQADTEGDFTYSVSGNAATVSGYSGSDVNLVIPASLGGVPVTSIASRAA